MQTATLNQSPGLVGVVRARTVSTTALAAEAAELRPAGLDDGGAALLHGRNEGVAEPGRRPVMTAVAGWPPILALSKSGYMVELWLPQMARLVTAVTSTPAFWASCATARFWSSIVIANQRSAGTARALFMAMRQLVLQGLPTTRMRTSARRVLGDGLALADEDLAVDPEQVLALHARLARHGADEERPVDALEALVQRGGGHDPLEEREGAVLQLHDHPAQGAAARARSRSGAGSPAGRARTSSPRRCGRGGSSRFGRRRR